LTILAFLMNSSISARLSSHVLADAGACGAGAGACAVASCVAAGAAACANSVAMLL
jgi:hypothetical protein